jgi:hypothetical protein
MRPNVSPNLLHSGLTAVTATATQSHLELLEESQSADEIAQLWKAITTYLRKHAKQHGSEEVSS